MSGYLWKYYLEDDAERFRRVLETANYTTRSGTQKGHGGGQTAGVGLGIGSSGSFGTSPAFTAKGRKEYEGSHAPGAAVPTGLTLKRADINRRDASGRTLLHLASSSTSETAFDFASTLLEHPLTDVYVQDFENGWTALHRAFYAGNISIAQSILVRDTQDALGHGSGALHHHAGGLIKIKDKEGNGPFDLFEMTLEADMSAPGSRRLRSGSLSDSDEESMPGNADDGAKGRHSLVPYVDLQGDEVYTFGSNKNVTLGFGDEDDRQYPERINLRRPDHLYFRFYREFLESRAQNESTEPYIADPSPSSSKWMIDLPSIIRNKPIRILNVHMSKLHTAVLTDDPESNLYVCGHGPGGRLGVGDETTRYQFVCVEGGAVAHKKIVTVALGQNHTLALSDRGEIFSWGSNGLGQLGYDLPKSSTRNEEPVQTTPRQIFGPLKRETIIGIAASRIHSVAYTATALYTFGKNEGQLGIVHSESRSVEIQDTPRNVAASRFSSPILSVSAIDRATTILLESHEVLVFSNYGYTRLTFPLDGFTNYFLRSSFLTTKYESSPNRICKVVSGGDTICAMSTSGEVFTVVVSPSATVVQSKTASTTNPNKSKNALSQPSRIWSNKKSHMAARDVDIDQNGSIVLVTQAGSVWRRVKRANIKDATAAGIGEHKPKDYKYSRISGLTRVTAVRASGFGAYAAVREDSKKMRTDIGISPSSLWTDLWPLVPFQTLYPSDVDAPSFPPRDLISFIMRSEDPDDDIVAVLEPRDAPALPYDLLLCSTTSDVEIPMHQFMFSARSKVIRNALEEFDDSEPFAIADLLTIRRGTDKKLRIIFQGLDVLTTFNLVLYSYTDALAAVWNARSKKNQMAFRYRQTRIELLKTATRLEMTHLESSLKRIVPTQLKLSKDIESAYTDPAFFENADVVVRLANNEEAWVHGALVCQRCPFFEGLFKGRTGGQWLAQRRQEQGNTSDAIRVDLSHVQASVFQKVLRHIYADTGRELFDDVVAEDLDAFLDVVVDVMGVGNELMLDRLCEICQNLVGEYVTVRNVCQLLNAIAPCSISTFKDKALEYICYNFEAVSQHGHLEELDDEIVFDLDMTAQRLQQDCSIFARSGRLEEFLSEKYPDLERRTALEKQAKIDSILLLNKYGDGDVRAPASFKAGSFHQLSESPSLPKMRRPSKGTQGESWSPAASPALNSKRSATDLIFDMDDEDDVPQSPLPSSKQRSLETTSSSAKGETPSTSLLANQSPVDHDYRLEQPRAGPQINQQPLTRRVEAETTSPKSPGQPWGATPLPSAKLGMREIMEQASSSRTSNLSLGLSAAPPKEPKPSGSFSGKLSQKDRKKLQQSQQTQKQTSESSLPEAELLSASPNVTSPWQPFSAKQRPTTRTDSGPDSAIHTPPGPRTPQLTMRQTIANPSPTSKKQVTPVNATPQKPQNRSVSNDRPPTSPPTAHTLTPSKKAGSSSSKNTPRKSVTDIPGFAISDKPVAIQSVRHAPQRAKDASPAQLSMLDILSEQAIEKDVIKDFAAKRSLQEIQQEQEFQEWWDKESAKVMEEEAIKARRDSSSGRGGRGKRRGRGGRSKGKERTQAGGGASTAQT